MNSSRPLALGLILLLFLSGPGCGRDASYSGGEASILSCDLVVMGDTIAALVAALEAARNGASVILCHGRRSSDPWLLDEGVAAAAPLQAKTEGSAAEEASVELPEQDLRQALARWGGGWGKSWHYDLLAAESFRALEWFAQETEAAVEEVEPGLFLLRQLSFDQAYQKLIDAAGREGVRIISGTEIAEISPAEEGESASILVQISGGSPRWIQTRAVILAQGGYLGNARLMAEAAPGVKAVPWRSGDGAALQAAIDLELDLLQLDHFAWEAAVELDGRHLKAAYPEEAFLIAGDTARAVKEMTAQEMLTALLQIEERSGWLLVAEGQLREAEKEALAWPRYRGIDDFLETHSLDLPLLRRWFQNPEGPFRAVTVRAVAEYCLGGIAVDESGRVLRGGEPVEGIYAAGEATGGLHGRRLMPGAALSEALVWGRRVGREASLYAQR